MSLSAINNSNFSFLGLTSKNNNYQSQGVNTSGFGVGVKSPETLASNNGIKVREAGHQGYTGSIPTQDDMETASAFLAMIEESGSTETTESLGDKLGLSSLFGFGKPDSVGSCESPVISDREDAIEGCDLSNKFVYA